MTLDRPGLTSMSPADVLCGTAGTFRVAGILAPTSVTGTEPAPTLGPILGLRLTLRQGRCNTGPIGFILAPRKTPPQIVRRLNQAIVKIMAQPDVKEKLAAGGSEAVSSTPEQVAAKLKADDAWMRKMLDKVGVKKKS